MSLPREFRTQVRLYASVMLTWGNLEMEDMKNTLNACVCVCVCVCARVRVRVRVRMCAQSRPTLCNSMDCSPPGSSVHGISQARIPEWIATSSSRESS